MRHCTRVKALHDLIEAMRASRWMMVCGFRSSSSRKTPHPRDRKLIIVDSSVWIDNIRRADTQPDRVLRVTETDEETQATSQC